ncbi:hypothetical protein EVAR_30108_1 [Eumeta japonica]|uniref:Uncharacterized protein n=1 Tax=Eumeta variegata TaxID=151549 RepID=A0A4C1WHQ6_EUMVA|nr:hypothetical protein EVAR_30108_1 [Eumeta japonica]
MSHVTIYTWPESRLPERHWLYHRLAEPRQAETICISCAIVLVTCVVRYSSWDSLQCVEQGKRFDLTLPPFAIANGGNIERQCSHTSPPHDPLHTSRIEEEVCQKVSFYPKDDLDLVSLLEVKGLVKDLKTRKAPGLDGISNKAIKCFSSPTLVLLVTIFNACLKKMLLSQGVERCRYHQHSKTGETTRRPR